MRNVATVVDAMEAHEGEGFLVHRSMPTPKLRHLDPFLLLDHMGPQDLAPGMAKGAPDHPHRGFETVTYMLFGEMEHRDSAGNSGKIAPGDIQWMTAGSGVVHSEMPSAAFQNAGGRMEGFQLWVNLTKDRKMSPPRYQDVRADDVKVVELEKAKVKIIAGTYNEVSGPADTSSPITYLHVLAQPGAQIPLSFPVSQNVGLYVVEGSALVNNQAARQFQFVVMDHDGNDFTLSVPGDANEEASVLVFAGEPLNEPIARYGPFVMNTEEELIQAVQDFNAGRMGVIAS